MLNTSIRISGVIRELPTFFQKLQFTLGPETPLEENLRALMASTLSKLKRFSGAAVAIHAFAHPLLREIDAIVVGNNDATLQALDKELAYRHRPEELNRDHRQELPNYQRLRLKKKLETEIRESFFDSAELLPRTRKYRSLHWLLRELRKSAPQEFSSLPISDNEAAMVLPLGTGDHRLLGSFILWTPGTADFACEPKDLLVFRKSFEQFMISFTRNLYRIEPHTYIPGYDTSTERQVTLFCAEIRNFDRICEILRGRRDIKPKQATACLGELVKSFTRVAAEIIEGKDGRIDQNWGSGLLAIFGAQRDARTPSQAPNCMKAVEAAADFVDTFDSCLRDWFTNHFMIDSFKQMYPEDVKIGPAVAIDHGRALFDYVGSSRHQLYLAIGDRVDLVKSLVSIAGQQTIDTSCGEALYSWLLTALKQRGAERSQGQLEAPIILSQTAYCWAKDVLKELDGEPSGILDQPLLISLPRKSMRYPVHPIWPDHVVRKTSI